MIKGIIQKYYRYRHVAYACLIALLLSLCGYFTNNWPILTGEHLGMYTFFEWGKNLFNTYILNTHEDDYSGALFVNTSMDKDLIDILEDGDTVGNTDITDRHKLLEFLKLLEHTNYKYVVIDIRFAEELATKKDTTDIDKRLFEQIKSMKRCVVATNRGIKLLGGLESKAAMASYKSTVVATNFIRYEYFDSIPSIPLHVYNELQKEQGLDTINYKHASWSIFNEGCSLCQNTVFLKFSSKGFSQFNQITTELGNPVFTGDSTFVQKFNYHNLGYYTDPLISKKLPKNEVLDMITGDMKEAGNGDRPIVFIGNILEELHDTYAGLQPGVIILYNAIKALQDGKHKVSIIHAILLFALYFIMVLFVLKDKSTMDLLPDSIKSRFPFLFFISKLLTLTVALVVIDIIILKYFGITNNFIPTVILLNTIKLYNQLKKAIS